MASRVSREIWDYDSHADFEADGGQDKYGDGIILIDSVLHVCKNKTLTEVAGSSANAVVLPSNSATVTYTATGKVKSYSSTATSFTFNYNSFDQLISVVRNGITYIINYVSSTIIAIVGNGKTKTITLDASGKFISSVVA